MSHIFKSGRRFSTGFSAEMPMFVINLQKTSLSDEIFDKHLNFDENASLKLKVKF